MTTSTLFWLRIPLLLAFATIVVVLLWAFLRRSE
jgi:hypothetical protein